MSVKIDCYLTFGCPSGEGLRGNIQDALAMEGMGAEVNMHRVGDKEALELGLRGSPTVVVNGSELQPLDEGSFS